MVEYIRYFLNPKKIKELTMSNFFSRSKGDMKYLFKKKETLSKKERRRKRRGWGTLIGLILILVQLVFTVLLMFNIFKLDILPLKYLIAVNAFLILIFLYNFTSQFTKAHIIGKILSVILSGVILFIYLVSAKLDSVLTKLNIPEINTDVVDICVLSTDKANSINDIANYKFAYNSSASNENVKTAFNSLKSDINRNDIEMAEYKSWDDLVDAFYTNKDVQVLVMNDSMIGVISTQYEDFADQIKIIKKYEYKKLVQTQKSTVNVKKDPFVIYVSGISSDDGADSELSDRGLSDVNILAVVNPETRQILLVTTPRDSYIKITGPDGRKGYDKLTHAGNYGVEASMETLEDLYGVNIDYYVKINFSGCVAVVDALGGITIDSEIEFTCGQDASPIPYHFVKGENECDGEMAVAFSRERHAFLAGDFQRGRNQTAAIKAILQKATSPAILTKYSAVLDAVSDMFLTNIPTSTISDIVKMQLSDSKSWNIQTYSINGTTEPPAGQSAAYLEITGLRGASVVYPYADSINTAIKLMSMIQNGEVFDVDEYVESQNQSNN
ncbi:MAG TPA: hypothetical protein DCR83_01290 [Eubacterium sp.]|nr:hypothetical protein [Eubacterium sp.]HCO34313.1 hypothetical protein [Eubacterium sp.]